MKNEQVKIALILYKLNETVTKADFEAYFDLHAEDVILWVLMLEKNEINAYLKHMPNYILIKESHGHLAR